MGDKVFIDCLDDLTGAADAADVDTPALVHELWRMKAVPFLRELYPWLDDDGASWVYDRSFPHGYDIVAVTTFALQLKPGEDVNGVSV